MRSNCSQAPQHRASQPEPRIPATIDSAAIDSAAAADSVIDAPKSAAQSRPGFWGECTDLTGRPGQTSNRTATAINNGLQRAWQQDNPISWILARVRCEFLKLAPAQYGAEHGSLSVSTLLDLERNRPPDSARYDPRTFSALFRGWDEIARRRADPRIDNLLKEAQRRVLEELTKNQPSETYKVYSQWRFVVGPECFTNVTKISYKNLWARSHNLQLPEFSEALAHGRALGFLPEAASGPQLWRCNWAVALREAWIADSVRRGRPAELARLHTTLAALSIEIINDSLGPHSQAQLSAQTVAALASHQPVPWIHVEPLFRHLRAREVLSDAELADTCGAWLVDDAQRGPRVCDELREIALKAEIPNRLLADALDIPRVLANKPVMPVFRALSYNESSALAPQGVLAHLIVTDDQAVERIIERRRNEIADSRRRRGSLIQSPIAVERHLWNVSYDELSADKKEVQTLEWKRGNPQREQEIVEQVRQIGEQRAAQAIDSLLRIKDESTVASLFSSLIYRHGVAPLEPILKTSQPLLKAIARDEEVPSLPRLKGFLQLLGKPLTASLELDWRLKTAQHEALLVHSDVLRFLRSYIAEVATSRQDAFRAAGAEPARLARFLHNLSATSYLQRQRALKVANAIGLRPGNPCQGAFRLVLSLGSISTALAHRLDQVDHDGRVRSALHELLQKSPEVPVTASSLPALRRARRDGVSCSAGVDLALQFLREFPGVTIADISRALSGAHEKPEQALYQQLIQQSNSRQLPTIALPAVAAENIPLNRKQPELISQAIRAHTPSPFLPLGVLAYLSSKDEAQAGTQLARVQAAARQELEALRAPATELSIQMRVWGVRPEDLKLPDKDLNAALWSSNDNEAHCHRALQLLAAIRDTKAITSLERATLRMQAATPAEIFSWASDTPQGAEREICAQAGMVFGAPTNIIAGSSVPLFHQLRTASRLAGIRITPEIQLRWAMQFAEQLINRGHSPASRILVAQAALAQTEHHRGSNGADSDPIKNLVNRAALNSTEYRRVFRRLRSDGVISKEHATVILGALGFDARSPFAMLLAACSSHQNMREAIAAWGARLQVDEPLLAGIEGLSQALIATGTPLERGRLPLAALLSACAAAGSAEPSFSRSAGAVGLVFAGATRAEIVGGCQAILQQRENLAIAEAQRKAELLQEQSFIAAERRRTQAQVVLASTWAPTLTERSLTFEGRITLLAGRLRRDVLVTNQELLSLFQSEIPHIKPLESALGVELPWFIGVLDAYRYPDSALAVMKAQLRAGLVPKHPGKVLFLQHMTWVHERGSLGKLNETSVKLAFEERFIAPAAYRSSVGGQ